MQGNANECRKWFYPGGPRTERGRPYFFDVSDDGTGLISVDFHSSSSFRSAQLLPGLDRMNQMNAIGQIQINSDGTNARPYCGWSRDCLWDSAAQKTCAEKLCEAAGFADGWAAGWAAGSAASGLSDAGE